MDDHAEVLEPVDALITRELMLRTDAGEFGTPVTAQGLSLIAYGALVALESGDVDVAKGVLAGYCAMLSEANCRCYAPNRHGRRRHRARIRAIQRRTADRPPRSRPY